MESNLQKYLLELSGKLAACDDLEFNAYDYSGGNYDDAYYVGNMDGEILLARDLLTRFFT